MNQPILRKGRLGHQELESIVAFNTALLAFDVLVVRLGNLGELDRQAPLGRPLTDRILIQ